MLSRRVSFVPNGIGQQKPFHYGEMLRVAWENRRELPFAWRILRDGVCDGCALGTSGLRDWTIPGVHLCMVRLELLRLNTAGALDPRRLQNVAALAEKSSTKLRELGRLPEPMRRRRGEPGFTTITWDEALEEIARELRRVDPQRAAFYLTSRGITNEVYYTAQKLARLLGTNHVDNSARLCHAASTSAMRATLGYGASTCSYVDWLDAGLIVFFGSNTPNNQPVTTKYLVEATRRAAQIAVVNTYREPGLARYWVPSIASSALFGTRLADHWFDVHTGGDLAFLVGVLRALIEADAVDVDFINRCTTGWDDARASALAVPWEALEAQSGATVADMRRFARLLVDRPDAIFVWSMGLTQHAHGVETIRALINVALARGLVGRPRRGLMPIRGHSGVQGGAEVGCVPSIDEERRRRWEAVWGVRVPTEPGLTAAEMVDASARGEIDLFWIVGGNFLETLAGESRTREALARPRLRIHQDIVLTPAMLVEPSDTVLLLPAATRYESPGGGTETTTERRIIFSPEIPGRRIGSARPEWEVFRDAFVRAFPDRRREMPFPDAAAIRREIGQAIPLYAGIEGLARKGDAIQWGGRLLFADGRFGTKDGRARFSTIALPSRPRPAARTFFVSTRRGKQFNSMVQRDVDPLTGARRDDVLMSAGDAERLRVADGDRVRLVSAAGAFDARVRCAPMRDGNLAVHWPEGNVLLSPDVRDASSHEPDYNATVRVLVPPLAAVDHLLIGCADLEAGIAWLEQRTGARAVSGGSHPGWGTRNALVPLGGPRYLELLAPDPAQPDYACPIEVRDCVTPRLVAWAVIAHDLDGAIAAAHAAGVDLDGPHAGSRTTAGGATLSWRVAYVRREGATSRPDIVPFLIEWGANVPHPSAAPPQGCTLRALDLAHPDPDGVSRVLAALGIRADIARADVPGMRAVLDTRKGRVELF